MNLKNIGLKHRYLEKNQTFIISVFFTLLTNQLIPNTQNMIIKGIITAWRRGSLPNT